MMRAIFCLSARSQRFAGWLGDLIFTLCAALIVASALGITYLNSSNWPTGGDAASHLLYAWLYAKDLLFSGQIVPWVPEVFGGMPFLSYYFPLPFIVIAVLSKLIGLASAFKWGSFLAAMLLPGAVYTASRRWLNFSWHAAFFGGLGALAFVLHEQNSIWGGNLLSTLAGEFAYSYGLLFAVLAMMAWARAINLGRGWLLAALMEAASGFSHGFPLLVVGFSSVFLLVDGFAGSDKQRLKTSIGILLRGHLLAFALLGGWLWPMIEMHSLTIPNDASFPVGGWNDLLPATLWPSVAAGLLGVAMLVFPSVRRGWDEGQRRAVCYFTSAAGLAAVAFIAGDQLGLADIRFFPLVWILGAIACGWLLGQALASFDWHQEQRRSVCYFFSAAVLTAATLIAGDQLGLHDIRFFPLVWVLGAITCGWLLNQALSSFGWKQEQWHDVCSIFSAAVLAVIGNRLGWSDLTFLPLIWVLGASACGWLLGRALSSFGWNQEQRRDVRYIFTVAGLAIVGNQLGLTDIRFLPLAWVLGAIILDWLLGQVPLSFGTKINSNNTVLASLYRVLLVAAACLSMLGWLGEHIQKAPDWGLWNHSGLEAKPQWNNLSQLFPVMKGDLWSPRLAFEHDPTNNDLGSTRSLEALPMFLNHRPVLEGLYMESALLGPAIYQIQSEISTHPSSPLVRFPSGSLDPQFAAKHLNFMHADTILLRSTDAKNAIEASGFFNKFAESSPYALYHLKQFNSHLAEVVTQPMRARPAQDWMQDAFAWFRTRSRFDAYLPVYGNGKTGMGVVPNDGNKGAVASPVREKSLSRSELIFETDAIGKPHLIKIAYHPRWHLESKGTLQIAGPGFMLVTPDEKEIRLVYGHTFVGKLGIASTLIAFIFVAFLIRKRVTLPANAPIESNTSHAGRRFWLPVFAGWTFLVLAGLYFGSHSPERVYTQAWDAMNTSQYKEASQYFLRAYQLRRPPAKKEEALFWLAKSSEQAGQKAEAKARYRELFERYHGYWVPEALYTYIQFEKQDGHRAEVEPLVQRMREEYPNNPWTLKLDQAQ
ncbi:MAG: hypothetical protein ACXU8A_01055 [Burkholderiaceae bacterium]